MAAYASQPAAFYGAAADGHEFANFVVLANFQPRRLASVSKILRRHPDRAKWKEAVVGANLCGAFNRDVRNQMASFAKLNIGPNYAIRPNLAAGMNLGAGINDGCGMDFHLPRRRLLGLHRFLRRRIWTSRPVNQPAAHQSLGGTLVADVGRSFHAPRIAAPDSHVDLDAQLIAWNHGAPELRFFNSGEQHQLGFAVFHFAEEQNSTRLSHGLYDEHTRHHWNARKVPGKKGFVDRNVLDGHNSLLAFKFDDAIDQQERKTVRQKTLNIIDIQSDLRGRGRFGCSVR